MRRYGSVKDILTAETSDLTELAKLAGDDDPLDFYTYVNLDSIDVDDAGARKLARSLRTMVKDGNPDTALRAEWEERITAFEEQRFGKQRHEDKRDLKPARENFFYRLATAYGEQPEQANLAYYDTALADKNRHFWNRWWYSKFKEGAFSTTKEHSVSTEVQFHAKNIPPLSKQEQRIYKRIIAEVPEPKNLEKIDFSRLHFTQMLAFEGFFFMCECLFDNSTIDRNSDFRNTRFSGDTSFRNAHFNGDTSFGNARFSGDAIFFDTQFDRNASFRNARFSGDTTFFGTHFNGHASFHNARFNSNASFESSYFKHNTSFKRAHFAYGHPKDLKL